MDRVEETRPVDGCYGRGANIFWGDSSGEVLLRPHSNPRFFYEIRNECI